MGGINNTRVTLTGICTLLVAGSVFAKDFYVAPDGADGNPGTLEKPFKNPIATASNLMPGDTLYFRTGNYRCKTDRVIGLAPSCNGKKDAPITFQNYNNEHVRLNVKGADWGLSNNGYSWIVFDGFEVVNGKTHCMKLAKHHPGSKFSGHHVTVRNCAMTKAGNSANLFAFETPYLTIENCWFHNARRSHGIYINRGCHNSIIRNITSEHNHGNSGLQINAGGGTTTNCVIENCVLRHNAHGFSIINCRKSTFRNNVVYNDGYKGPRGSGWREIILTASHDNLFENNTFVNTLPPNHTISRMVRSKSGSRGNIFRNNIFAVKRKPVFHLQSKKGFEFENNCLYNIGGGQQVEKKGALEKWAKASGLKASGTIAADPKFVDINNFKLELKEDSPCIDAGAKTDAKTKVVGKARDIGAHEFGAELNVGCNLPWKKK